MAMSQDAMALIRQWEGCRLSAYPDPASGGEPWTIGYGHTGPQVKPGQRITLEQAERWLLEDLATAEAAVVRLLQPPAGMSQRQREALTSFCFNVGSGALAGSTLRRRLNGGEPVAKVLEEELPRWVKGPNGPMEGLVRRRQAELAHARGGRAPEATAPGRQESDPIALEVPYFSQRDSVTAHGDRMCFSSTCAMAAAFLRPGCLSGSGQPDDRYLGIVQRYGDTTEATAQMHALQGLGIRARFRTDGRIEDLIRQLGRGVPVPVGWLHHGPVNAPRGGGHWSLVVGWDPARRAVLMHDPNGEADLVGGGYVTTPPAAAGRSATRRRTGDGAGWWKEPAVAGFWI